MLATKHNPRPQPSVSTQWLQDRCNMYINAAKLKLTKGTSTSKQEDTRKLTSIKHIMIAAVSGTAFRAFKHNMSQLEEA